jgi:predicted phage-related endonuclease
MTKVGELATPTGVLVMDAETMNSDREAWLAARRWRGHTIGPHSLGYCIGSSDVPSILDLDGVDTPAHVYRNKVHGVSGPVNEAMEWGHIFEPAIALEWQRRNRTVTSEVGLLAHVDKPWHQTTLDRLVTSCPLSKEGESCFLETKNVGYSSASRWKRDLPDRILAQIAHQAFVTGFSHGHYACNIGGNMLKQGVFYADREADLIAYVVAEVDRMRDDNLIRGIEPEWDTSRKAAKLIELDTATHPIRAGELTVEEIGDVMAYAQAAAEESAAGKRKKALAARLRQLADGAELVLFSDHPAYGYRPSSKAKVNLDALLERHPDAYADPEVVSETTYHTLVIDPSYRVKIQEEK